MEEPSGSPSDETESNQTSRGRKISDASDDSIDGGRPYMGIMIFGKEWSDKIHVGNVILGSDAFGSQAPPNQCVAAEELVDDKHLTVVLTPNLISSQLTQEDLQRRMKECVSLCGPGPQACILVARPQDLTEDDRKRVEMILTSVLDQALERTLVVKFLPEDEDGVGCSVDDNESDALHCLIQVCGRGCYSFNRKHGEDHMQVEILKIIDNIMTTVETQSLLFDDASETFQRQKPNPKIVSSLPPMNLMLFGRKGISRTSISNILLSQSDAEQNISSDFVMRQAEVCGYAVTLVEAPSLATTPLSKEEVLKECHHSISQCAHGINAFLLALPGGNLTDEDKEELQMIQSNFGPRVNDYIMILYTNVSCPKGRPVQDSLQENTNLEQQFPKGCFVLSMEGGHEQISEMLKKIKGTSDECFTTDMFVEAQIEERGRLQTELEKEKKKIEEMMKQLNSSPVIQNPHSVPDYVRIVNNKFQMAEAAIKEKFENMMKERELEMKREKEQLKAKFDEEIKAMDEKTREIQREREEREKLLREKEEYYFKRLQIRDEVERRERQEREAEDKMRRVKEELWTTTLEEVERKHKEQKEVWEMEHKKQLKEEKERAAKEHEEWLERQRKERSEFERRQEEERRRRDEEERSRKKKEELERQKLEARVKEAEKLTKEILMERIKELKEWEDERKKETLNHQKERKEWERVQKKMKEDFETEKERARKERDYIEEVRREQERKEKERMEHKLAEQIEEMKNAWEKLEMEWTKAREEETERRRREDEESQRSLRELQEEFEREMEEEKKRRKKEEEDREVLLREKEEDIRKEGQRRDEREKREKEEREAEDKRRRDEEETQTQSWIRTLEEVEQKHKEQKEVWEMKHKKLLKERAANEHEEWTERQRKEIKKIEEQNQKETEKLIKKHEDEARKKAEEFNGFLEKHNKDLETLKAQHRTETDELIKQSKEWEEKYDNDCDVS